MTSQPGKQTIAIHILSIISKSKGNQAIKYGQLKEYNMINIFLEKSYIKCGEKSKLSVSLDQLSKILYSLFSLHAKLRAIEIYLN